MAHPAAAADTWVWPAKGRITQGYGCTGFSWEPAYGSCRHFHKGIDIANVAWTKIRAASSGVVKYVGYNPYDPPGDQAWIVRIQHDNGLIGLYGHMKPTRVNGARAGDRVNAGQLIGYMGMTGMATGVHLHFGFFLNGVPKNPKNYITYPCCSPTSSSPTALVTSDTNNASVSSVDMDGPKKPQATKPETTRPRVIRLPEKRYPLPV